MTEEQQQVMDVLADNTPRIAADIAREAKVSAGVVKGLVGKGLVEEVDIFNPAPCRRPDPMRDGPELSEAQDAGLKISTSSTRPFPTSPFTTPAQT